MTDRRSSRDTKGGRAKESVLVKHNPLQAPTNETCKQISGFAVGPFPDRSRISLLFNQWCLGPLGKKLGFDEGEITAALEIFVDWFSDISVENFAESVRSLARIMASYTSLIILGIRNPIATWSGLTGPFRNNLLTGI